MTTKGFDSWGATTFPDAGEYKFAYFNFTLFWPPHSIHKVFPQQMKLAKELGYLRGPYSMWRYYVNQEKHAQFVVDNLPERELPLALDFEDKWAIKGIRTVERIAKWGKAITDKVPDVIIYTGKWWWDDFVAPYHSYFKSFGWSPYDYPLWECDPDPDTALPGLGKWEGKDIMRQIMLDVPNVPYFNATIDVNHADEAWYQSYVTPYPPSQKTEIEVIYKSDEATIKLTGV